MGIQIDIDLILFCRCFAALIWGILLAVYLQFNRLGVFLAKERTWLAVVVGVGVDLLLGINATWWAIWLIVAFSSIGIVVRSIVNEHQEGEPALNRYKTKWAMEEGIDACGDTITALQKALEETSGAEQVRQISLALAAAHRANRNITSARYGEIEKKSR